ncbi:hypothetical protein FPQ18DRAFT_306695 [Pyronema domesticum]|nr:hypothetical protein FPQ18DRAFT_306695 [Pyronema domesticum]
MKTASLFTPLLLSAFFSLSTAAVTPQAMGYTEVMLFSSRGWEPKDRFLRDMWYPAGKNTGCIVLADKFHRFGTFGTVPEMHMNKIQAFRCNAETCYARKPMRK